jgi:hypothetical protein
MCLACTLEGGGTIELFACWEGDQAAAPVRRRELTADSLRAEGFIFEEKELIVIRPQER